jgi:hypothetical protein
LQGRFAIAWLNFMAWFESLLVENAHQMQKQLEFDIPASVQRMNNR